jgi:hypothetical protein
MQIHHLNQIIPGLDLEVILKLVGKLLEQVPSLESKIAGLLMLMAHVLLPNHCKV